MHANVMWHIEMLESMCKIESIGKRKVYIAYRKFSLFSKNIKYNLLMHYNCS